MAQQHQILSSLDNAIADKHAKGQEFRVTDFLWQIVRIEQMAIDTSEERQAISDGVMARYDALAAKIVPEAYRERTREFIKGILDTSLLAAANFKPPVVDPKPA